MSAAAELRETLKLQIAQQAALVELLLQANVFTEAAWQEECRRKLALVNTVLNEEPAYAEIRQLRSL